MTTVARPRAGAAIATVLGLVAVIVATVVGWNAGLLDAIVAPPPIVRAFLVGLAVAAGVTLLTRSIARMSASGDTPGGEPDVPGLIRAVRLAFLAVAAFAAAAGWALAHPLPLVVAAVIAGIDVIETSFLLLVVGRGR
jgi:hypothetical protein